MSDRLYAMYGKPVHTNGEYAVFVCTPMNIDIVTDAYAAFNLTTEVREAEFSNLAHAIAGCEALDESLKDVRNPKKKKSFDDLEVPSVLQ